MEIYLHSLVRLHGMVLNSLSPGITLTARTYLLVSVAYVPVV
jgi:hypothetical protein